MSNAKKTAKPNQTPEEIQAAVAAAVQKLVAQGKKEGMIRAADLNAQLEKLQLTPEKIEEIYDQFDALRKDKTTIFVSHRLSSATTADAILVLDNGVLVEYGAHSELMKKEGVYHKLFKTQAGRYLEENGSAAEDTNKEEGEL